MIDQKLIKTSTLFSIATGSFLVILKLIAWYITDAVTLLSSLMDSAMDVLVALINFVAVRYSFKPADSDHRFGHAKAQDLAALAQAVFIAALSVGISIQAVSKFIHPSQIESGWIGIAVMIISLVLTAALITFQHYVVRKTKSNIIHADATHYLTDLLSNLSIIIVLFISTYYSVEWLDPTLGIILALYILKSAYDIGKQAFDNLMDKEFALTERDSIMAIILNHPKVKSINELKTRHGGHKSFIQFDFTMDGNATLNEAHQVAHEIEAALLQKYPDAEIFIHQEPAE